MAKRSHFLFTAKHESVEDEREREETRIRKAWVLTKMARYVAETRRLRRGRRRRRHWRRMTKKVRTHTHAKQKKQKRKGGNKTQSRRKTVRSARGCNCDGEEKRNELLERQFSDTVEDWGQEKEIWMKTRGGV